MPTKPINTLIYIGLIILALIILLPIAFGIIKVALEIVRIILSVALVIFIIVVMWRFFTRKRA